MWDFECQPVCEMREGAIEKELIFLSGVVLSKKVWKKQAGRSKLSPWGYSPFGFKG